MIQNFAAVNADTAMGLEEAQRIAHEELTDNGDDLFRATKAFEILNSECEQHLETLVDIDPYFFERVYWSLKSANAHAKDHEAHSLYFVLRDVAETLDMNRRWEGSDNYKEALREVRLSNEITIFDGGADIEDALRMEEENLKILKAEHARIEIDEPERVENHMFGWYASEDIQKDLERLQAAQRNEDMLNFIYGVEKIADLYRAKSTLESKLHKHYPGYLPDEEYTLTNYSP